MANRRLPRVSTTQERKTRKNLESDDVIEAKLFTGLKYNSMGIKHRLEERSDRIELPKMNDRHYNLEKITKDTKEKYFKYSMALKRKRAKFLEDVLLLDEQWKHLEGKENALKESMVFYNKFLRENMMKRERFVENIRINRSTKKKYDEDIEELKRKNFRMVEIREMFREQISKHSIYEDFLRNVTYSQNEYNSVHSLISRIELLLSTVENTADKFNADNNQLSTLKLEVERKNTRKFFEIGHLRNEVAILNKRYVSIIEKSKKSEKLLDEIRTETNRFFSNLILACEFIHQLYLSMCIRQGKRVEFFKGDLQNQLVLIGKSMEMFDDIIHICANKKRKVKIFKAKSAN